MFKTKLTLAIAGLLAFSLFFAALLYWGVTQSLHHLERSRSAHRVLDDYLALSADTYRLFKQYRRNLQANSDWQASAELVTFERAFESKVARLRQDIQAEVETLDSAEERAEEADELVHLIRLTEEIQQALADVRTAQALFAEGREDEATVLLTGVLEETIDRRVTALIGEAIQEEAAEAEAADLALVETNAELLALAQVTAVLVSLLALAAGLLLRRSLTRPLRLLSAGTRQLAAGDLEHRIDLVGRDEFAQLAGSFNGMAAELQAARAKLQERGAALERANAELKKADSVRRDFFAEVGHELRTPLTILRGEGEVALDNAETSPEAYRAAVKRMVDQAEHLSQLVDDLFLIARSNAGAADLRNRDVGLAELARKVCDDLRTLAEPKGIEISLAQEGGEAVVLGDRRRLRQLLVILLENAVRYGRLGDRVSVALARRGDWFEVRVADTGPGISKDDLDHVFDRFYRGTAGRRLSSDGSGLGLPLAKSIAEAHAGRIAIESTVGRGTAISIRLPAPESAPESAPEPVPESEGEALVAGSWRGGEA